MQELEFHVFVGGAYPRVPFAGKGKSNYISLPNGTYDATYGQRTLEDQVETLVAAERLGFDGIAVSEQHNGPIGLHGNPMVAASWVAARTERLAIGSWGPILNAYANPIKLAEEIAAADTLSRGRLSVALPMGHGMQHHSLGYMNPAVVRRRFREAHDLLVAALTEEGPFEWNGEFFQVPYVNVWPRPLQRPHPPFVLPGGGSLETLELAARLRYRYMQVLNPRAVYLRNLQRFRDLCAAEGYATDPSQIVTVMSVHVAETDAQARREAEAHDLWMYQNFFRSPGHDNFPPGYVSGASLRGVLGGGYRSTPMNEMSWDELAAEHWVVAGSAETVAARLRESLEESGAGILVVDVNAGVKPRWLALKSLTLFAEEVIPRLRPGGVPAWKRRELAGYETSSEYGARRPADAPRASRRTSAMASSMRSSRTSRSCASRSSRGRPAEAFAAALLEPVVARHVQQGRDRSRADLQRLPARGVPAEQPSTRPAVHEVGHDRAVERLLALVPREQREVVGDGPVVGLVDIADPGLRPLHAVERVEAGVEVDVLERVRRAVALVDAVADERRRALEGAVERPIHAELEVARLLAHRVVGADERARVREGATAGEVEEHERAAPARQVADHDADDLECADVERLVGERSGDVPARHQRAGERHRRLAERDRDRLRAVRRMQAERAPDERVDQLGAELVVVVELVAERDQLPGVIGGRGREVVHVAHSAGSGSSCPSARRRRPRRWPSNVASARRRGAMQSPIRCTATIPARASASGSATRSW